MQTVLSRSGTLPTRDVLDGLEPLSPDHLTGFKRAVEAGGQMGWAYYFPYLLAHEKPGRRSVFIREDDDSLCVFRRDSEGSASRLDLVFPPIPMNTRALVRALELANDFNGDRSTKVLRVDSRDADAVAAVPGVRLRQRRAQYVFEPTRYSSLTGSALHTVRRNVARVERLPEVSVERFQTAHVPECRALLQKWGEHHTSEHGTEGGRGFTRRVLGYVGKLPEVDLSGEVVLVEGRVVAFALGGMIRPGLGCSLERKNDPSIRGLSYFHFRSFLRSLEAFDRVNDGSDVKRAGVRQFKDSFRPVAMEPEYRASQIGAAS